MSTSGPGALAERGQLVARRLKDVPLGIELREALAPGKARDVGARVLAQQEHVRLERRVAARHHLASHPDHVVQGANGRE